MAAINLHSKYAKEIQTEQYGFGYEGLMAEKAAQNKLIGIVNAIIFLTLGPGLL